MSIIRGSELLRHRWRMLIATIVFGLFLGLLTGGIWLWYHPPSFQEGAWQISTAYWIAQGCVSVGLSQIRLTVPTDEGPQRWVVTQIVENHGAQHIAADTVAALADSAYYYGYLAAGASAVWFLVAGGYGYVSWNDRAVAGARLSSRPVFLARQVLTRWLWSHYSVAGIRLPKNAETLHLVIVGSTGAGKTTATLDLLDQIRARGDAAIVYDPDGTLLSCFYRAKKDIVLNPFDARMPGWAPGPECPQPHQCFDFAEAMMAKDPREGGDSVWDVGATHLIASTLEHLLREGRCTSRALYQMLATMPLEEVEAHLKGTPAGVVMNKSIERTALSVRFTAMKRIAAFRYLLDPSEGDIFSIRRFVENPHGGWLFLSAPADMRALLRPMLTIWLHLAATALLSLPPSPTRRLWFILDEAASLNRLPALSTLLQEGRRFGACVVLGLQSLSQLSSLYGEQEAITLLSMPQTTVALRTPEPRTAELLAQRLGRHVFVESKESVQYGGHPTRDGVSLSETYTTRYIVEPAALQCLPDRVGYLKLPGAEPLVRVSLRVKRRVQMAAPLIPRDTSTDRPESTAATTSPSSPSSTQARTSGLAELADELTAQDEPW